MWSRYASFHNNSSVFFICSHSLTWYSILPWSPFFFVKLEITGLYFLILWATFKRILSVYCSLSVKICSPQRSILCPYLVTGTLWVIGYESEINICKTLYNMWVVYSPHLFQAGLIMASILPWTVFMAVSILASIYFLVGIIWGLSSAWAAFILDVTCSSVASDSQMAANRYSFYSWSIGVPWLPVMSLPLQQSNSAILSAIIQSHFWHQLSFV
jgi:hypothetical protein